MDLLSLLHQVNRAMYSTTQQGKKGKSLLHSCPKYVIKSGTALHPHHASACVPVQTFMCSELTGS